MISRTSNELPCFVILDDGFYWKVRIEMADGVRFELTQDCSWPVFKTGVFNGGWGEIRTHARLLLAGFQDRCIQPLYHPSAERMTPLYLINLNLQPFFIISWLSWLSFNQIYIFVRYFYNSRNQGLGMQLFQC